MNPMEHVWSQLDCRLRQRQPHPTNKAKLWDTIVETWADMEDSFLFSLYGSMTRRVAALGAANGSYTKY
ncbi:hypothetical protein BDN70DRAFT_811758 [Pholiota conissans]|uniref:Uncharacterized protein n=1 Tax=Pholiota conissans TaxID=109636 RepID=A0A9P5YWG7_9AGAR|nr:hypothetical protein BDN70DRAFT_811758 [Pholiota conissans]